MGNGKMKTTATTIILVVAMTALAIAISSNAWMKMKEKTDYFGIGDSKFRFGLWDFCLCDDVVEDISSGFGEVDPYGSSSEEKKDIPTWYRVSQGCALLSQILLIITAILFFLKSSNKKGIFIVRIALCICSVISIFATVALFGDQFRKNEFETPESKEQSYIEPHWGMGLAILALLLTFICIVLHIIAYKFRNKEEESSPCHLSDALDNTVLLLILLANCSMAVAIASPTWMKYVPTTSEPDTSIHSYGLWERCECIPMYLWHKSFNQIDDSSEERDDSFPLWLSACQWCAILGLISMATSFLLQFVCLFNACSKSRALRVASMVMIGIAGCLMVASIVVYRLEFKSMELVKSFKILDHKPHMDYGIFVNMGAVGATVAALVFGIIDLCVVSCC